jgi:hypothetical protein
VITLIALISSGKSRDGLIDERLQGEVLDLLDYQIAKNGELMHIFLIYRQK